MSSNDKESKVCGLVESANQKEANTKVNAHPHDGQDDFEDDSTASKDPITENLREPKVEHFGQLSNEPTLAEPHEHEQNEQKKDDSERNREPTPVADRLVPKEEILSDGEQEYHSKDVRDAPSRSQGENAQMASVASKDPIVTENLREPKVEDISQLSNEPTLAELDQPQEEQVDASTFETAMDRRRFINKTMERVGEKLRRVQAIFDEIMSDEEEERYGEDREHMSMADRPAPQEDDLEDGAGDEADTLDERSLEAYLDREIEKLARITAIVDAELARYPVTGQKRSGDDDNNEDSAKHPKLEQESGSDE